MTDNGFWDARPTLRRAQTQARARRVGPWSLLSVQLVRAIASVPPNVGLPPLVGARASLNMFVNLVGHSAGGKGVSEALGAEAITIDGTGPIRVVPLGSGEGIARTFIVDDENDDHGTAAAIFSASEADTLTALAARQGSTTSSELRKAWSGETLGHGNAGKDSRRIVDAHTYRMGLIVGMQHLRSGPVLAAVDGGLPQRFSWAPTWDRTAPIVAPDWPGNLTVTMPNWGTSPVDLAVPITVAREIDERRLAALHGETVNPLDGHADLVRLKLAAALMALDGRHELTEEDWQLSGVLMSVSAMTRQECQEALADQARAINRSRANAVAEREEIIDDRKALRAREAILRKLDSQGQQTKNELRRAMKSTIRDYLDPAIDELVERGEIAISPGRRGTQHVHVYQRYTPSKHPLSSDDRACTESTRGPTPLDLARNREPRQRQRSRGKYRTAQLTEDASA